MRDFSKNANANYGKWGLKLRNVGSNMEEAFNRNEREKQLWDALQQK
jgi:hypothetical protein